MQEGEEGADVEDKGKEEEYEPYFDPLGVATVDLKAAQAIRVMKAANEMAPVRYILF